MGAILLHLWLNALLGNQSRNIGTLFLAPTSRESCLTSLSHFSKEHIFGPLNMDTSFYLTASKRERLIKMTHLRQDGSLEKWADQLGVIEQDPEKCMLLQAVQVPLSMI